MERFHYSRAICSICRHRIDSVTVRAVPASGPNSQFLLSLARCVSSEYGPAALTLHLITLPLLPSAYIYNSLLYLYPFFPLTLLCSPSPPLSYYLSPSSFSVSPLSPSPSLSLFTSLFLFFPLPLTPSPSLSSYSFLSLPLSHFLCPSHILPIPRLLLLLSPTHSPSPPILGLWRAVSAASITCWSGCTTQSSSTTLPPTAASSPSASLCLPWPSSSPPSSWRYLPQLLRGL